MDVLIPIGIVAIILIILIVNLNSARKTIREKDAELEAAYSDATLTRKRNDELSEKNRELSKYQPILDAEAEASKIREEARLYYTGEVNKAKFEVEELTKQAKDNLSQSRQKLSESRQQSEALLNDAVSRSAAIIAEAETKAKDIAGDAYEIAKNAEYYQEVATAMKNIIKGYGDEYLKPSDSVLDGLAEEFGYTEAGKELKAARLVTNTMITQNLAATCKYSEQNRRETAIAFITDAFNGKVDSILSLVKTDNYGVLEQKIKDAYAVVNNLGRPFRDARITPAFLDARLNELRWAVAVVVIKAQEREEQRRIREQMREEEKARREYERAIREAEKEESTLRKAMEKAHAEIAKASAAEKAKYEERLAALTEKLAEAEARSQRALSMAQQTKSGHVYIISNIGSFGEEVFKIGMTRRLEPMDRVKELGDASVPFPFDVHAMIYSEDAPALETALHKAFALNQVNKVNPRKEFFRIPISEIKKAVEERELEVSWTILAQAAQYRETLAIERQLQNSANRDEWIRRQNEIADSEESVGMDEENEE